MIKTSLIITVATSIAGTISAFTWIPPALDSGRIWANEPAIEAIKELTIVSAQAKQWDIRTDELTEDVRDLKTDIKALEKALGDDPAMPAQYRSILQLRIESDKKRLDGKSGALDRATTTDQKILSTLRGTSI
jgi:hypothetical protein